MKHFGIKQENEADVSSVGIGFEPDFQRSSFLFGFLYLFIAQENEDPMTTNNQDCCLTGTRATKILCQESVRATKLQKNKRC